MILARHRRLAIVVERTGNLRRGLAFDALEEIDDPRRGVLRRIERVFAQNSEDGLLGLGGTVKGNEAVHAIPLDLEPLIRALKPREHAERILICC